MTLRARRYSRRADPVAIPGAELALPKPCHLAATDEADLSTMAHPKDKPDRDEAYKAFVRMELCAVNGEANNECAGHTEAAHLEGYGTGIKASDYLTYPACTYHHHLQHQMGIGPFQIAYGVNLWEVGLRLLVRFIRRNRN